MHREQECNFPSMPHLFGTFVNIHVPNRRQWFKKFLAIAANKILIRPFRFPQSNFVHPSRFWRGRPLNPLTCANIDKLTINISSTLHYRLWSFIHDIKFISNFDPQAKWCSMRNTNNLSSTNPLQSLTKHTQKLELNLQARFSPYISITFISIEIQRHCKRRSVWYLLFATTFCPLTPFMFSFSTLTHCPVFGGSSKLCKNLFSSCVPGFL